MLRYKFDVLERLKEQGYSTYKLRKEKIFGEATMQKMRAGIVVAAESLDTLCHLLKCQPGDILEHLEDEK